MADTPDTAAPKAAAKPKSRKKPALKVVETVAEAVPEVVPAEIAQIEETVTEAASTVSSRFGKAIEDAKASAANLSGEARERTTALTETVTATASEYTEKAGEYAEQAKVVALDLARQGKGKATAALGALGETIESNAGVLDEKLGVQYGDYARGAAHTLQSTAASLEAKDIPEIGEEIVTFVKKSPVKALGIAAVTGFVLTRLLRRKPAPVDVSEEAAEA
ncbi:hypothetical protein [Novosphingobium sp. PASSN1]|uniref:hypothetical protein n=1 Tax=Novosphingobium sp. PASSN1 TaxID=2015561 RepID=UPI000BD36AAD|nr:hypothetical protein [Novosphingobium sp. PASSN1]OYU33341.1 MAG: hypothetical protein CFE35_20560 [Novosphingobium sp. PASSN1]